MTTTGRRHRILINAIHARAGGGVTYLRNLLPLLATEPDLELHLIAHPDQKDSFAAALPMIRLHEVTMPRRWFALLLWEQIVLPFIACRIGFDAMLSPANFAPLALPVQAIVIQNAVGVGAHEGRLAKKIYWAALRVMTFLSLLVVRRAIAVSRYVADTAAAPFRLAGIAVIHHGVEPVFAPTQAISPSDGFLLAVGDLYVQKNLHHLIDALVIVRRRYPSMTLRIAGAEIDVGYAAGLRQRIVALGMGDAVVLLGRRPIAELVELYRSCAIFVFPSLMESFGMPLVEAMACGAPVVASNAGAVPEIAGGAALLCDPGRADDIAEKILRVLDDPALRRSLRDRSLARAKAFSWETCARRTAGVLREVVMARGGHRLAAPSPPR